ncbi:N-acetylmuramoyl-L-alanine amidase [Kitasatospora paracochleata]|uniref:N-acetylmuramoyl-L-alanine amidase n=1 Tax=Kitasatospora paracochleata TaxID=58354 RepID=A0ABT1IZN5_9ACTN|nr:N-acetylmuramoyl-L-alanine amidase [Kitasatospora paracochleata]MCP2310630.1 N-acetylmuramoyl-L-alanine amidase [Kitasatospora paracochleata]
MTPRTADAQSDDPFTEPPRRSRGFRVAVSSGAVLSVCLVGWLGWQALANSGSGSAGTAAPRVSAAYGEGDLVDSLGLGGGAGGASGSPGASAGVSAPPSGSAQPSAGGGSAAGGARPLTGRTVLLDPGHNSGNVRHTSDIARQVDIGNSRKECDTTGTSTNDGYSESDFTLDVVHRARQILQDRGATVVLTQDGDRAWGPCIDERARIGNEAKADAAVSVHGDGAPGSASGFHVIMPAKVVAGKADTSAIVDPSHKLGVTLRDGFKAATGEPFADYIGQQGLDTRSDLGGLNLSRVPKVFIECGNMRNSGDAQRMTDPQWRQRAAQGIADSLTAFLTTG